MPNNPLQKLGNNIRRTRQQKGLSQEELAELASLHRTYIGGIERGERNVGFKNLLKIARALEVSISHILEGIE